MKIILAYIRLTRPANIITAIADILAGFSVTLFLQSEGTLFEINYHDLFFLMLATIGLYGGGVVMNDVADAELDKIERPERPIPSGLVSRTEAGIFGIMLLIAGIIFASFISNISLIIASSIALLALLYDFKGKHHNFFGPINMGLCRGGNLLLGMSASIAAIENYYLLAIIPVIYISAITMISRGEVVGGNKKAIAFAAIMYAVVVSFILLIPFYFSVNRYHSESHFFIIIFVLLIYRPLIIAFKNPEPNNVRNAVKRGVISLIVMNTAIASCFAGFEYGLIVLALFPISILLAKVFAVT